MCEWEHLAKAPIVEALIDIRVQLPVHADVESLSSFRDEVGEDYPTCRARRRGHAQVVFNPGRPPTVKAESDAPDGFLLTSGDGTQVVQARLDGFTFSRLKPYQTWEKLRDGAFPLWDHYLRIAKPVSITRISVRYINRLDLPLPFDDFQDWVLTVPQIAPLLPQSLAGYYMRLNVPFENPKGFVSLTQAIEPGEYDTHVPMIFDIDAFSPSHLRPGDKELRTRFEGLRRIKNMVFFRSVTDKARELWR